LGGPREAPRSGFQSYPSEYSEPKVRARSEKFADHYSQARQFYISQTKVEQDHIAASFTFELSKVETPAIRARMVSHLLNVDKGLAGRVAQALGLRELPQPAEAAMPTRMDLKESPALSILGNPPESFKGRKVGALVTDGVSIDLVRALKKALDKEGTALEFIGPTVGGVKASDGSLIEIQEQINGGPSVLYDAVAVLPSRDGIEILAREAAVRDFVSDAFAHLKFIAYVDSALPLLEKVVGRDDLDAGFVRLKDAKDVPKFIQTCRKLRFWERTEAKV
jgi:catalase